MTVQNKKTKEPVLESVDISKGTITFRTALMLMIFAATPPGQQVLKNFGLTSPPNEGAGAIQKEIETVRIDVAEVKRDVSEVKKDVSGVKDQATKLESGFNKFSVDLDRFRADSKADHK